ncbi:hypothetical protein BDK51DRAFT_51682 [Blyttiomyces helicus]|uniref:Cyclin N-terminal domain-containing protein n=1 Tax=Blyttiomyces helicus TaxID=388810 RepID=A0A4P9W980_9FUNG|nr:hypothetical protein BDK51DRAFT_51682 [Blyttiomyces helicus]|eukprot:RKO88712.1 hypothetical protein BDK51DRAFT_51682 [Blyttiomyces helicus]
MALRNRTHRNLAVAAHVDAPVNPHPLDPTQPAHNDLAAYLATLLWEHAAPTPLAHEFIIAHPRHAAFRGFVAHLLERTEVSLSTVLLALKYMQRMAREPGSPAAHQPLATAFLAALLLANKFLDDGSFTNAAWADAGGIPVADLNRAEWEALEAIEFELAVSEEEYMGWIVAVSKAASRLPQMAIQAMLPATVENYLADYDSRARPAADSGTVYGPAAEKAPLSRGSSTRQFDSLRPRLQP